jgi:hypothetical protein
MATNQAAIRKELILTNHEQWDTWILSLRSKVDRYNLWPYLDPDTAEADVPKLVQPTRPSYDTVKPEATKLADLSTEERLELSELRAIYMEDQRLYTKQWDVYNELRDWFLQTTATSLHPFFVRLSEPRLMLIEIKRHCTIINHIREIELGQEYAKQKQTPKNKDLNTWINNWEVLYQKCKTANIAEVTQDRPVFDFLAAIRPLAPSFADVWLELYQAKKLNGEALPELPKVVEMFRNHRRLVGTQTSQSNTNQAAFPASFQGQTATEHNFTCLCGESHRFNECVYLNPYIRPDGWKGDSTLEQKIQDILKKNEKRKQQIDNMLKYQKRKFKADSDTTRDTTKDSPIPTPASNQSKSSKSRGQKSTEEPMVMMAIHPPSGQSHTSPPSSFNTDAAYELRDSFILDSGATGHICNNRARFIEYQPATEVQEVKIGDTYATIAGYGMAVAYMERPDGTIARVRFADTAHIPGFHTSCISVKRLKQRGVYWNTYTNMLEHNKQPIYHVKELHQQFVLEFNEVTVPNLYHPELNCFLTHRQSARPRTDSVATASIWHQRFGHCGPRVLEHIGNALTGVKLKGPSTCECEVCAVSKMHTKISRRPRDRATTPFQKVHWDLIYHDEEGWNKEWYTSHFQDDCTRFHIVYTIRDRTQATLLSTFEQLYAYVERQFGICIQAFMMDNEPGLGHEFDNWTRPLGIRVENSAVDTPAQNGAAERAGGVILTKARAMRIAARLPANAWSELEPMAAHIANRQPCEVLDWKTPFEYLQEKLGVPETRRQPAGVHLRVPGCRAYPRDKDVPRGAKNTPRAHIGYLVGYDSTNIYRIWIPSRNIVLSTRDVIFDESRLYDPNEPDLVDLLGTEPEYICEVIHVHPLITLTEELTQTTPESNIPNATATGPANDAGQQQQNEQDSTPDETSIQTPECESSESDHFLPTPRPTPPIDLSSPTATERAPTPTGLDTRPQNTAPRAAEISGTYDPNLIIEGSRTRRPSARRQAYLAALHHPEDAPSYYAAFTAALDRSEESRPRLHRDQLPPPPKSWRELKQHPHAADFLAAAQTEFTSLQRKGMFESIHLTPQIASQTVLPLLWVYTYKFDTDGYLLKYKARVCVRGDLQPQSNLHDTYAATLAAKVFRLLMAIIAYFDLETVQLDAVNAFANSHLDELVYTEYPEGFEEYGKVLRLLRALYGLRRSPVLWLRELSKTLQECGFQAVGDEICLFSNGWMLIFFYVDDIVCCCRKEHLSRMNAIIEALCRRYEMRNMGELSWFLGIRVVRDRPNRKLWLCQDSYIDKIIKRYHLEHRKTPYTPLPSEPLVPYESSATPQEIHAYQQRVGSLNFATTVTRADAAKASSILAEFMQNPSPKHMDAADHALLYLNGTKSLAIEFSAGKTTMEATIKELPDDPEHFQAASDAAFADDIKTRRSSEGYLFKLFGGPIDWRATKQRTVTTSTTEAELLALSSAAKEAIWWKRFFKSIDLELDHELVLQCDNKQTVGALQKDSNLIRTKLRHIDIHNHWLRQEVRDARINVQWVPTTEMPADGLTKPLPRQRHEAFIRQLGLVDIADKLRAVQQAAMDKQH